MNVTEINFPYTNKQTPSIMKQLKPTLQIVQLSLVAIFSATLLLHTVSSSHLLRGLLTAAPALSISAAAAATATLLFFLSTRHSKPVYLLNYSCFKPGDDRKCNYAAAESFVRRTGQFNDVSEGFMQRIYLKSGLGEETYAPPFVFDQSGAVAGYGHPTLESAMEEAREGVFSSVDSLLGKTKVDPRRIDVVIATCGCFSPEPSLSSEVVNRYNMRDDVKSYNLSGMGCSSGVVSIDMAARLLRKQKKIQYVLVIITESISLNWYFGENRSMLVTNCIFRVGSAAALITNDPTIRHVAKMQLVDSLRTHHGSNDRAYRAAFQEEDDKGNTGIALTKDLIPVAGANLREHIKTLAPRVLPLTQLATYAYSVLAESKPRVPDFRTAFDHFCIHTGGKAVIEQVGRVMGLTDEETEPARMTLNRFGNTSSSLVFYELAYFEAKGRVKRGDRVWMVAFGTGFKVGSLVWKSLRDASCMVDEEDNPWLDCIGRYPVPF